MAELKDSIPKLTEDRTVELLRGRLKEEGWTIESHCLGQKRGYDVAALKGSEKLIVEVKGTRGNPKAPTTTRPFFSAGQIKINFGAAIIKSLKTKLEHPEAIVAIA